MGINNMSLKDVCKIVKFPDFGDKDGDLIVIENGQVLPFNMERIFFIQNTSIGTVRGKHANRVSEFVLLNINGSSKVRITDGKEEIIVELNKPMEGVYIPRMIWKDMYDFSKDSILLVITNTRYDDNEYIRDYNKYLEEVNGKE